MLVGRQRPRFGDSMIGVDSIRWTPQPVRVSIYVEMKTQKDKQRR